MGAFSRLQDALAVSRFRFAGRNWAERRCSRKYLHIGNTYAYQVGTLRIVCRQAHQAYLKILLEGAVGSAYAAMDEWEMEKRCEESPWEEVLAAVWARKREMEFLGEVIEAREALQDPDLPEEVRKFLKAMLESYPDLDIRILAAARRRERSEEGREELTRVMRGSCSVIERHPWWMALVRGGRLRSAPPGPPSLTATVR